VPDTLEGYAPFAVFLILLVGLGGAMLGISSFFPKKSRGGKTKLEPWECGVEPLQTSNRERFAVPFYLVAILFIIFDLETVFLFPWAVVAKSFPHPEDAAIRLQLLLEVFAFVAILGVGLFYVWRRKGLEWD
jgi:NADH:ubiquinone oxidoreductase subunit 3 (subunit A)